MTLRNTMVAALISSVLAGCGSGEKPITDPSKLKPLNDAQKAEIKAQDNLVHQEESQSYDGKKKKSK
ncbi:MAG: hypothetical protein WCJ40_14755 [Planctomycetota bacterium]|nr:hypothetical protein [Planctomycetota bacterium]